MPSENLAAAIAVVTAYVAHNAVPAAHLPDLIVSVHAAFQARAGAPVTAAPREPAVPVAQSLFRDRIVCLEDGEVFKSLKRHIMTAYGLTPDEYRIRWGLPADYPMVAPDYAARRSQLAKDMGLGTMRTPVRKAA